MLPALWLRLRTGLKSAVQMAQTSPTRSGPVFWRGGENKDQSWSQFFQKGSKDWTGLDLRALLTLAWTLHPLPLWYLNKVISRCETCSYQNLKTILGHTQLSCQSLKGLASISQQGLKSLLAAHQKIGVSFTLLMLSCILFCSMQLGNGKV